ncbi:MAG: hypothetical protein AAF900_02175 [Bacteroidota bacterium]
MRKEVKQQMDKLREQMQWLPSSLDESTFNNIALILAAKNGYLVNPEVFN